MVCSRLEHLLIGRAWKSEISLKGKYIFKDVSNFKRTKKCSLGKGISVFSYQEFNIENQGIKSLVEN